MSSSHLLSEARKRAIKVKWKDLKQNIILDCGLLDELYSVDVISETARDDIMVSHRKLSVSLILLIHVFATTSVLT